MFGYPASIVVYVSKSDYVKVISNSVLSGRFLVGFAFGSVHKIYIVVECQTFLLLHSVFHQVSYDPYYCRLPLGVPKVEIGADCPVVRYITGVDAD